jgi:hypothetical protein
VTLKIQSPSELKTKLGAGHFCDPQGSRSGSYTELGAGRFVTLKKAKRYEAKRVTDRSHDPKENQAVRRKSWSG